ncbi:MAG TPA: 3'-5' exonuclease, partial [Ktedonobacterales bacterium]|nr:3'-5' exonuclease [Ktedonobacterales bacterium]
SLEPDSSADVLPSNIEGEDLSLPPQIEDGEALPVRCFLRYLAALRASGADIAVLASDEDAVRVMTLHTSKGLEFTVVYLPNLAQGQFPTTGGRREDPSPPGFREDDAPGERDAEERCLFYVGVTRARDTVVFTRAHWYARNGTAKPSPLLGLVESAPQYLDAPSPLTDEELARLQAEAELRATSVETDDDGDDEETSDGRGPVAIPADVARSKPVFPLNELEQYLRCPRQYKYASIYRLLDPAQDAVYRFHRYVRRGRGELARLRAENPQAGWSAANERLRDVWAEVGPAGHAYENAYWRNADQILRDEWHALASPTLVAEAGAPATEALRAELRGCIVEVHPERIIMPESGSAAPAVLVRQHIGRESQEHKKDRALPLLYIAHQQQHPEIPVRIKLAYLGNVLADTDSDPNTPESADATFQHTVLDVTAEARKKADTYLREDRKAHSALDNLDRAALDILAGRFPVAPRNNACDTCPYRLICPADPGEDADEIARR